MSNEVQQHPEKVLDFQLIDGIPELDVSQRSILVVECLRWSPAGKPIVLICCHDISTELTSQRIHHSEDHPGLHYSEDPVALGPGQQRDHG